MTSKPENFQQTQKRKPSTAVDKHCTYHLEIQWFFWSFAAAMFPGIYLDSTYQIVIIFSVTKEV